MMSLSGKEHNAKSHCTCSTKYFYVNNFKIETVVYYFQFDIYGLFFQLRRVKMDDIKYPKFDMKDFRGIPRNRLLYAAICTILDQPKDKKGAEAAKKAAEEYWKFSALEQTMYSMKMMTTVSYYFTLQIKQLRSCIDVKHI